MSGPDKSTGINLYYNVYFEGNGFQAFGDWFSGAKSIGKTGPYKTKADAIAAAQGHTRACIVYHAGNQVCLHSQQGYIQQAVPELLRWAREHISIFSTIIVKNDMMLTMPAAHGDTHQRSTPETAHGDTHQCSTPETAHGDTHQCSTPETAAPHAREEANHWAFSKFKSISHTSEYTEFQIGVDNLAKLVKGTVAAMVGNIPGILDAVSGLTIDICYGQDTKKEGEAWIKDIKDTDGNEGILVMKGLNETTIKKKFFGKDKKKMYLSGIVSVLVPLTPYAKQQCSNIKNQHASNIIAQIEKEFNLSGGTPVPPTEG
jgi:hypothetical protein